MKLSRERHLFWAGTALVSLGAVLYCSWPLGYWLNPPAAAHGLASEFEALGQPYNWMFIGGDVVSGLALVVGCVILGGAMRAQGLLRLCLALLALYGICGVLDASLPMHCLPSLQTCGPILHDPLLILHGAFDYVGSFALLGTLIAAWQFAKHQASVWMPWIYMIAIAGILFGLLSLVLYIFDGPGYWAQRYYLTISSIWVVSLPFVLRGRKLWTRASR